MKNIQRIEINFPCLVDLPDGMGHALSCIVEIICRTYEKQNPHRVMWPSGHGSKPNWFKMGCGIPEFADDIFEISISEKSRTKPNRRKIDIQPILNILDYVKKELDNG